MAALKYLLKIDVSPFGGQSSSRTLGSAYTKAYTTAHPNIDIRVRDLVESPTALLDIELITAGFVPETARPASQQAKHEARLELIKELIESHEVVITAPMWNWSIPAVLKAYIDQIVLVGALDPYGNKKLAGKKVTVLLGSGDGYGPDSEHPEWDFTAPYLTHIFTVLGCEDVQVIRAEYSAAGRRPGSEALVPKKEKSLADGIAAAEARAKTI